MSVKLFRRMDPMAKVLQLKSNELYQLKITLDESKPPIWRRFLVPSGIKLPDLHKVIQTVMGWTNSHLHQFRKGDIFYSVPDEDAVPEVIDYTKIRLHKVLVSVKDTLSYEYDFGDGWEHTVILEKILPNDGQFKNPVCVTGKRNCPPEDCGGVPGYERILEIIVDPENDEYEEITEWLGGDYDPEEFDRDFINDLLEEKDYGCIVFDD